MVGEYLEVFWLWGVRVTGIGMVYHTLKSREDYGRSQFRVVRRRYIDSHLKSDKDL